MPRFSKPRCFLVYALAPDGLSVAAANRRFNAFIADQTLPLVVFHDHFVDRPGGFAIFYAETAQQRETLENAEALRDWRVEIHLLVFSHSPAGFDDQTAFTLRQYRGVDWERLRLSP